MTKKIISILLSICLLFGCLGVGLVGASATRTAVPIVYIQGQGSYLYADANDPNSEVIYGSGSDSLSDTLTEDLTGLMPLLISAYMKNDFTEYNNSLVELYAPYFERIALDKNGEVSDGSGNKCTQNPATVNTYNNGYGITDYYFIYDWRLDPVVLAGELDAYINSVLAVTHAQKVNLVGRCLGGNIVLAYLHEYGDEKVANISLYAAGLEGIDIVGALFSGEISVNADSLERYMNVNADETDEVMHTLRAVISVANSTFALNWGIKEIMDFYEKIYLDVVPRLMAVSFGTFPSYWSMVGDEYFEKAVELNFGQDPEYAEMVRKINYYHYEIFDNTKDILTECINDGIGVQIISKYGFQSIPVCKESEEQSDVYVSTSSMSLGATVAGMQKTFDSKYIKAAEENGTAKYISADKQIDASTCFLPDSTWFIKDLSHKRMPNCVDELMAVFFASDGKMTVFSDERYTQYLKYDEATASVTPLTEENEQSNDEQKFDGDAAGDFAFLLDKITTFFTEMFTAFMTALTAFLQQFTSDTNGTALVL